MRKAVADQIEHHREMMDYHLNNYNGAREAGKPEFEDRYIEEAAHHATVLTALLLLHNPK